MNEKENLLQLQRLCNNLMLGELIDSPVSVTGGLLHRMYAIQTTSGTYAIKVLNSEIMCRPTAMQNYVTSERIANYATNFVPALPAKKFNGDCIQKVGDQFHLIFDWIDGKSLKQNEITTVHCERMGGVLSCLHLTDFSELGIVNSLSDNRVPTDWNYYLKKGRESNAKWTNHLLEIIENLQDWNTTAIKAANELTSEMVISHGDLDPKNVMWSAHNPILIDWESAGYRNPMQELIETAIYWSETESGEIDKDKFFAFINGYQKSHEPIQANWRMILASGFLGKLDWLEYSLKRSLWIECIDEKDQQAGTEQVLGTITAIRRYAKMTSEIEQWLKEKSKFSKH
ncbi:Ser/Thr protein kinase RdoA involved in Cpx stress response, MazF antagonist [Paenibacillus sp. 1_12]|uniref:phosphotransferase n=1 Tax=Paenibacillus sp. 1_12 TaxID=1566278 RepID=UPI0008F1B600|nr:phosphotransferase [Paenibacillus sp. 1_12]SFL59480.1 Ser/Thr protein kinase RdoA involved in Cpx stress response, MazF antagonist [Paenibacillus sp. 1_12]